MSHVLWLDNFSKFVARTIPSQERSTFANCLWTGAALSQFQTEHISDNIKFDGAGSVVPAMPPDLLMCSRQVVQGLTRTLNEGFLYYDQSLVAQYDVRSIPLKIDGKRFPEVASTVDHARNKMSIVFPQKLVGTNIGSNRGLICLIRQYYDDYNMSGDDGSCERYLNINVDENIFYRILKVSCSHVFLVSHSRLLFVTSCTAPLPLFVLPDDVRHFSGRTTTANLHQFVVGLVAQLQVGDHSNYAGVF